MVEGNSPQHCLYRFESDTGVKKYYVKIRLGVWTIEVRICKILVSGFDPHPSLNQLVINRENLYWVSGRCGHCASLKNLRNPIVTGLAHILIENMILIIYLGVAGNRWPAWFGARIKLCEFESRRPDNII